MYLSTQCKAKEKNKPESQLETKVHRVYFVYIIAKKCSKCTQVVTKHLNKVVKSHRNDVLASAKNHRDRWSFLIYSCYQLRLPKKVYSFVIQSLF